MPDRHVVIVAFKDVEPLDVTGPASVFALAGGYEVTVAALTRDPLATKDGFAIVPEATLDELAGRPIDTLLVAGGHGADDEIVGLEVVPWLRANADRPRRIGSVCMGAFVLGEAGLLDGRRATTHWRACDQLAERYPAARIEREPIFVIDGHVSTSAGVTAGMDLALALVEQDRGPQRAHAVARDMVLFVRRPGGQAQLSAQLAAQTAEEPVLRDLQAWINDHLGENLTVAVLADRAGMSERSFARAFTREVGITPAAYVETLRVQRARIELETTSANTAAIASTCGFGTPESMRRAFARRVGVSPAVYRARYAAA